MHSDKPYKSDKSFGKGLEMSFEQMTALACTEYPVLVNDGVVLLGYQTLLVPTEITADYVQFHLEVNHTGQMNPFSMNYGPRALTIDHLAFKELRCYVGWCEAAHIMLGNQHGSAYDVRYSGGQQKKSSLHFDGISTGFQFFPAAPIHTGVTGQANFSLTTNRVNFSPSNVYSKMLRDAANDVAMVYDARSRQSWVVPKISVLLHMAHAWIKENSSATEFESPDFQDPIPFVGPHFDGFAVVAALENAGDTVVCGVAQDALRLRTLLLGLNINLLRVATATEPSDSRAIFGFEFMDVVTEPGKGGMMKKITLLSQARNSHWLKIANDVDLVILCAGLGNAIQAVPSAARKKEMCNFLPTGLDLLAVHLSCMRQLTKRHGGELAPVIYSSEVLLSCGRSWSVRGDPFKDCLHDNLSTHSCWDRATILQRVRKTRENVASVSRKIALSGAIVFGSRNSGLSFL